MNRDLDSREGGGRAIGSVMEWRESQVKKFREYQEATAGQACLVIKFRTHQLSFSLSLFNRERASKLNWIAREIYYSQRYSTYCTV